MINSINSVNINNVKPSAVGVINPGASNSVNFRADNSQIQNNILSLYSNMNKNAVRTTLTKNEKQIYSKVLSALPRTQKKQL